MRALQYARTGEPAEVLSTVELPKPEPRAGEVRLRMLRSPIHNHDLATIRGTYGVKPQLPAISGSELLGVVDAAGDGAELTLGSRVVTMTTGAWAEFVVAPAGGCTPVPDALSDDVACQLLAMPLSALVLLDELQVDAGAWILQNAANGAVGRVVMKLAQSRGVRVVNLVRNASAAEQLRKHGAKHVIISDSESWSADVRELLGREPLARVVDSIAGEQSLELQRLLGSHGHYVVFGALSGQAMRLDPGLLIFNETTVRGFWMTSWMARASAQTRGRAIKKIFQFALSGELPLPVGGTYAFSNAEAAMTAAEKSGRVGKILLSP